LITNFKLFFPIKIKSLFSVMALAALFELELGSCLQANKKANNKIK
jgi:hypothetical protein